MICDKLKEMVIKEYVLPSERLYGYKFVRELNRKTHTYSYLLNLYLEDKALGFCTKRSILLGTSIRSVSK